MTPGWNGGSLRCAAATRAQLGGAIARPPLGVFGEDLHDQHGEASEAEVRVPAKMKLECYSQGRWESIDPGFADSASAGGLEGHRPTKIAIGSRSVERIRIELEPQPSRRGILFIVRVARSIPRPVPRTAIALVEPLRSPTTAKPSLIPTR